MQIIDGKATATLFGINELMKRYGFETSGKNCVVVGRSNIVGRPMTKISLLSNTLFAAKGNIYN